jgi:hypothetical protein
VLKYQTIFTSVLRFIENVGYLHKVGQEYPLSRSKWISGLSFVQAYVGDQNILAFIFFII